MHRRAPAPSQTRVARVQDFPFMGRSVPGSTRSTASMQKRLWTFLPRHFAGFLYSSQRK